MLKVKFADGTIKQCVGLHPRSWLIDQTNRDGFDILFDASEDLNKLRQLSNKGGALNTVTLINDSFDDGSGEKQTVEQLFVGYTRPMGVGLDLLTTLIRKRSTWLAGCVHI